jgi:hypothetical protein
MVHLYKGAAKYYPRKPGERLRAIRRNSDEGYDEQLRNCSNHLSKYEQKNLESSLGVYWEL